MNYFCTLFDSNYLSRGIAMYESLSKYCNNFHLYIFAFDNDCFKILKKLQLFNVTVISLNDFENEKLLALKSTRNRAEYCWTCTPSIILYCLDKFNLDHCTYLDADLYFYSNPVILLEEMGAKSVLITEHRYTPKYDQTITSGKYCVQFITFKNSEDGIKVLKWWVDACIEWCYARFEDGKFGDQKYLDDWTTRFNCIHVLQNEGGGLAPWNIQQYKIRWKTPLILKNLWSNEKVKPVFYHFHSLSFCSKNIIELANEFYSISKEIKKCIYLPYIRHLTKIMNDLNKKYNDVDFNGVKEINITINKLTMRDKLYLYKNAFYSLSIKKIKDASKLIKEKQQPKGNFIIDGSTNKFNNIH